MPTIQARGLTKRFGADVLAVDHLDFDAIPGGVTGFLGPNGAGKTTTLRMLLGLVTPTSGSVVIDGHRYRHLPHPTMRVGAVLEASGFHPARTARNHLKLIATAAGIPFSRVEECLDLVGLSESGDRRVGGASSSPVRSWASPTSSFLTNRPMVSTRRASHGFATSSGSTRPRSRLSRRAAAS